MNNVKYKSTEGNLNVFSTKDGDGIVVAENYNNKESVFISNNDLQELFKKLGMGGGSTPILRANTVDHTPEDEGKEFTDRYGRTYTYTKNGMIY